MATTLPGTGVPITTAPVATINGAAAAASEVVQRVVMGSLVGTAFTDVSPATETTTAGIRTDIGTDGTSPPTVLGAGTGVRGWLRSIYEKLTGTLAVTAPGAAALALDATLTGGTLKAIARAAAKGATAAADLTSNPVDANTQALHVNLAGSNAVNATLSAETTKVIGTVNIAASQTVGLVAGANVIGGVTQSGTWTVQPGNTANTTPWLVAGGAASGATKAGNPLQIGGVFNTAQPTVTTGQAVEAQSTARGAQIVAPGVDNTATNAWFAKVTDGTNTATVKAASTAAAFTDVGAVVDLRPGGVLPASAALADAFANWTATQIAAGSMLFNGSTWDRQRGMSIATTTGDSGAKTATGNGATITNVGNKGIQVVIVLGTVSGTAPTAVFKMQSSVDAGTTWVDIPGATTTALIATGNFGISVYPGQAVLAGATTTNTTATANGVLARTWRVVWTIGGTTPSFAITSITYNYLPN